MTEVREGGCLCGAVRYEADWPPLVVATCSCKNCQKQAGSALSVIAVLRQSGLRVTGDLTTYNDTADSGKTVLRRFCGKCGAPVISETAEAQAQGLIFIKAGTLDQADDLTPTVHYWTSSAQHWVIFPETGAKLETQ